MNVLSLGAGVQSTTMALMAAKGEITPMPDAAIFADTQAEPQAVYKHLDWLESVLPYPVYRVSKGNLGAELVASATSKTRIANPPLFTGSPDNGGMLRRGCTSEYKIAPIESKLRDLLGKGPRVRIAKGSVTSWIGISLDEVERMKVSRRKWIDNRYPLIEKRMTRNDCLLWLERSGYPKPGKSACTFCPYHNDAHWREEKRCNSAAWQEAVRIDELIRDGIRGTRDRLYLHRSRKPLAEVDFTNDIDQGQEIFGFVNECDGMCGV